MKYLVFEPIRVETGSADEDGRLVLADGKLVAVLVRLSNKHEQPELRSAWFLEVGFGSWLGNRHEVFATLEDAEAWIDPGTRPAQSGNPPREIRALFHRSRGRPARC